MEATQIVHWPGKDIPACVKHLQQLIGLATAMGFPLNWTPCEGTVCTNCLYELCENEEKKRNETT